MTPRAPRSSGSTAKALGEKRGLARPIHEPAACRATGTSSAARAPGEAGSGRPLPRRVTDTNSLRPPHPLRFRLAIHEWVVLAVAIALTPHFSADVEARPALSVVARA